MSESSRKPPRGYMPFLVEHRCEECWACATPQCDSAEDLVYQITDPTTFEHTDILDWEGDAYGYSDRILRLFETRKEAVEACWTHAQRWWHGEPPAVPSIPNYDVLPEGYVIFIEVRQRRVWLQHPDGKRWGEFSGVSFGVGLSKYKDKAWCHYRE